MEQKSEGIPEEREEELTVLVDAIKDKSDKRSEHKGEVFNSYESWVRYSEKSELSEAVAHRAKTAARKARVVFERKSG